MLLTRANSGGQWQWLLKFVSPANNRKLVSINIPLLLILEPLFHKKPAHPHCRGAPNGARAAWLLEER